MGHCLDNVSFPCSDSCWPLRQPPELVGSIKWQHKYGILVYKSYSLGIIQSQKNLNRYKINIFFVSFPAVLVGATHPKSLEECLQRLLVHKDYLAGIALSGLADAAEDSVNVTVDQVEPLFKRLDVCAFLYSLLWLLLLIKAFNSIICIHKFLIILGTYTNSSF